MSRSNAFKRNKLASISISLNTEKLTLHFLYGLQFCCKAGWVAGPSLSVIPRSRNDGVLSLWTVPPVLGLRSLPRKKFLTINTKIDRWWKTINSSECSQYLPARPSDGNITFRALFLIFPFIRKSQIVVIMQETQMKCHYFSSPRFDLTIIYGK